MQKKRGNFFEEKLFFEIFLEKIIFRKILQGGRIIQFFRVPCTNIFAHCFFPGDYVTGIRLRRPELFYLKNSLNKVIFLELGGIEKTKSTPIRKNNLILLKRFQHVNYRQLILKIFFRNTFFCFWFFFQREFKKKKIMLNIDLIIEQMVEDF